MRAYVDFSRPPADCECVEDRLINWARWCMPGRAGASVHPMWRQFRPAQHWEAQAAAVPVDAVDAQACERTIYLGCEMRARFALRWCYVYRGSPRNMASRLETDLAGLLDLVNAGRRTVANSTGGVLTSTKPVLRSAPIDRAKA